MSKQVMDKGNNIIIVSENKNNIEDDETHILNID
jgi:hypothetical protein